MAADPPTPAKPAASASGLEAAVTAKAPPRDLPAVAQAESFLARSDFAGAVRASFPLVMIDVQWVYNLTFPRHWTARDVLAHGLRPDMGRLPDLLFHFYEVYEPVRFGEPRDWVAGDVREILRRIYTETGLQNRPAHPELVANPPPSPVFSVVPKDGRDRSEEGKKRW